MIARFLVIKVATALTVYGIETDRSISCIIGYWVATALTVYGIETGSYALRQRRQMVWLQQHLPFTVLKLCSYSSVTILITRKLQQHLPFTVLKLVNICFVWVNFHAVATALTVYGIETNCKFHACNFNYIIVATALTVYGIET